LSTVLRETTIDLSAAVALDPAHLGRHEWLRLDRKSSLAVGRAGRYGCVWLPVYALLVGHGDDGLLLTIGLATALAALWSFALGRAFATARLTLLALGPAPAAALGTAGGLALVSAAAFWSGLGLSLTLVTEMAAGVFFLSTIWEGAVDGSLASQRRVLVVGAGNGGAELVQELALGDTGPFRSVGLVDDDYEAEQLAGVPVHGRLDDLGAVVQAQRPDIVVLADDRPEAIGQLLDVASVGFKIVAPAEFHEHAFGRVPVRTLTPAWFTSVLHLYHRPYTRIAKRALDVVVALLGLLATAWAFPLLALVVSRTPGPVIFRQVRLGRGGKPFTIYKFRTMREDAEASGAVWAAKSDPRVTRAGAFLRLTRLDELPQLWNVLRGDMSIVGPRPERPEFLEELENAVPYWTRRHLVKPGITGWAQVRRGYTADAEGTADKLSYDLWYLRHRSLLLDLAICVKTVSTLVTGAGAR
jgi:exopolysaccharide biosynthesis polyprenyl glycosylphosphotransferase